MVTRLQTTSLVLTPLGRYLRRVLHGLNHLYDQLSRSKLVYAGMYAIKNLFTIPKICQQTEDQISPDGGQ